MLAAIREAFHRSYGALARNAELCVLKERFGLLSSRERDVLPLVVDGYLNKQVGAMLGISEFTVKAHRGQVMRKMEARTLADLIKMFGRLQLSQRSAAPQEFWHEAFFPLRVARRQPLSLVR